MTLQFPSSPTNGQRYGKFIWDAVKGVWGISAPTPLVERVEDLEALQAWRDSTLPAFHARLSADQTKSGGSSWVKINFNNERLDTKGSYDTTLCRFTAPVKGLYEFDLSLMTSTSNGGPLALIAVNAVPVAQTGFEIGGYGLNYASFAFSKIVELDVGGWVEAYLLNGNSTTVTLTAGYGNHFSGKLIAKT